MLIAETSSTWAWILLRTELKARTVEWHLSQVVETGESGLPSFRSAGEKMQSDVMELVLMAPSNSSTFLQKSISFVLEYHISYETIFCIVKDLKVGS
jgi:hypothetical protein